MRRLVRTCGLPELESADAARRARRPTPGGSTTGRNLHDEARERTHEPAWQATGSRSRGRLTGHGSGRSASAADAHGRALTSGRRAATLGPQPRPSSIVTPSTWISPRNVRESQRACLPVRWPRARRPRRRGPHRGHAGTPGRATGGPRDGVRRAVRGSGRDARHPAPRVRDGSCGGRRGRAGRVANRTPVRAGHPGARLRACARTSRGVRVGRRPGGGERRAGGPVRGAARRRGRGERARGAHGARRGGGPGPASRGAARL